MPSSRSCAAWWVAFASLLAASTAGCDSKKSSPEPPSATKPEVPASPVAAPLAAAAQPPDAAADTTLALGVLDFELVQHAGTFTLRDNAYELTFGHHPDVTEGKQTAPSGVKLKTVTAMADLGGADAYGMVALPIPRNVPYNVEQGIRQARDGSFSGIGVAMTSDVSASVGGIPGHKATASGVVSGTKIIVELQIAFDKPHHTLIELLAITGAAAFPAETTAFLGSLKIKPGEAPPAGDGT